MKTSFFTQSSISLESLKQSIKLDDNVLGCLIWWTVPKQRIPASIFQDILTNLNLPKLRKVSGKSALRKSLKSAEKSGLVRKIKDTPAEAVYALVKEKIDLVNLDIDLEKLNVVSYDKILKKLIFRNSSDEHTIIDLFDYFLENYTETDIRSYFLKLMRAQAIVVRKSGGIYFSTNTGLVKALEIISQSLPGTIIYWFPILDIENRMDVLMNIVTRKLAEEVSDLISFSSEIVSKKSGSKILDRKFEESKALREKISNFGGLLSDHGQDLKDRLMEMENRYSLAKLYVEDVEQEQLSLNMIT